jgi:hypothetical protein
MPFVSITRLRVRSWHYLPAFFMQTVRSALQARRASGNLAIAFLADAKRTYWTRTLWRDETAMHAFMVAGAHRQAMPHLLEWCDEASLVDWVQDSSAPPTWPEAHRRLLGEGRRSKVDHPSQAQDRFEIPAPRTSVALTLK